jgi:predicted small metal-binding protein
MADTNKHPSEESGSGDLDYGHNRPTGGTNANIGKINPQSPTSGTENFHPERKKNQQTTAAERDDADDRNAQNWTAREIPFPNNAPGNVSTGPVSPNAGDIQDESGDLRPGASATAGVGAGDPDGHYHYSCADAGNSDCRWEVASASSNELWADIERHHREVHGRPTLDEISRGRIQDAIHVRRAA